MNGAVRSGLEIISAVVLIAVSYEFGRRHAPQAVVILPAGLEEGRDQTSSTEPPPLAATSRVELASDPQAQELTEQPKQKAKLPPATKSPGQLLHSAEFYAASSEFNPNAKQLDKAELQELHNLIDGFNKSWAILRLNEGREVERAVEAKTTVGDFRSADTGEPIGVKTKGAAATHIEVTPSGGTRVFELNPGEFAGLDDIRDQKSALQAAGEERIKTWFAAH